MGSMSLRELAEARLDALEASNLRRRLRTVAGPQDPAFELDGRPVLGFCSNNYLGLANDPRLLHVARESLAREGLGAGASRLVSGTMSAHAAAEEVLAGFAGADAAILFATGYAANVGAISALVEPGDLILSDALNHASLIDGCRLSRAKTEVFRHLDLDDLETRLRASRGDAANAFIVTDSVFSMDGDEANLPALRALADRYDASLVVDEAHAVGVLSEGGRGMAFRDGVQVDVLVGALGKAFGSAGAFVAGSAPVIELLRNRARSFVFSTAPLPLVGRVAAAAVPIVLAAADRRARVLAHADRIRTELRALGFTVPAGGSPIVPVIVGEAADALALSAALLERGIFAQAIRPPTVPRGTARLRVVPIATHNTAHLDALVAAFAECACLAGTVSR